MLLRQENETLRTAGELLFDGKLRSGHSVPIRSCVCDPHLVRPGDLFILLPDQRVRDAGRRATEEAIARGCAVIAMERPHPRFRGMLDPSDETLPICIVPNARRTFGRIRHSLAGDPSARIDLFAVVGAPSIEKRIVAHLLAHVLAQQGGAVGLDETLSSSQGDFWAPRSTMDDSPRRVPESAALTERLTQMADAGWSNGVLDVSHQAIENECLAGVALRAVCITDATLPPFLRPGGQSTAIDRGSASLFNVLADDGLVVIDRDQPNAKSFLTRCPFPALTVGMSDEAQIVATPLESFPSEQTFLLSAGEDMIPVRTRIANPEHMRDCMMATAVGLSLGMELTSIVRGLESFDSLDELDV